MTINLSLSVCLTVFFKDLFTKKYNFKKTFIFKQNSSNYSSSLRICAKFRMPIEKALQPDRSKNKLICVTRPEKWANIVKGTRSARD